MSTWIEFGVWRRGPESKPNALILIWEKRFQCMNFLSLPVAIMLESVWLMLSGIRLLIINKIIDSFVSKSKLQPKFEL